VNLSNYQQHGQRKRTDLKIFLGILELQNVVLVGTAAIFLSGEQTARAFF
jgi:hypothetical protein